MYDIVSGYAFKMGDYVQSGIPIVNGESIQHGNVSTKNLNFLPEEFSDKYKGFVLNTGDIILGLNRPITNGNLKIAQVPTDLHGALLYQRAGKIISINSSDINFSYQLLGKEVTKFVLREAVGSDQPFISTTKLKKWLIFIPSLEEQFKIGNLFERIDNLITLHKRKYEALLKLKEAYLQNMFPAKDESVPKVRFANFDGDWEQRKLGEFAEITMGQSPSSENYTENPDDYILVQGNADIINGWVTPRIWTTQVTKIANVGDIILSVRAPVGDVGRTEYDVVLGRGVAGIRGNDFIFQMLNKMKSNGFWKKYSTGSTFESINSNNLKEAIIFMPDKDEQIQIGNFLNQLDNLIILHQEKLEKLKYMKEAFLQKMFI